MAARYSQLRLAGLLFLAGLAVTGCNPFLVPYLLNGEPKKPAAFKHLTNKDKPVRVAVLSYAPGADGSPEGVGADHDLCRKLVRQLLDATTASKEKIDLVAPRTVDKFKDEHPDYYKMDLKTMAEYFKADYVIFLEVESFDLYEAGNQMYRGRAQINVSLQDVHDAVGEPELKVYKTEYPKRGPVPIEDTNVVAFRDGFIDNTAQELSWLFTEHAATSGIARDE